MSGVIESFEKFDKDADKIIEMVDNVIEEVSKDSLGMVLSPFACAVIHTLLAKGKIKLC